MFQFGMKDLKLFFAVCACFLIFLMFCIPPDSWWFIWDYLAETPWWFVIGQAWPLWGLAGLTTFFLILYREIR
ncbi:MAG: hypothetical protein ACFFAU_19200 [Candidatus Hodarchaeota archaeon]